MEFHQNLTKFMYIFGIFQRENRLKQINSEDELTDEICR